MCIRDRQKTSTIILFALFAGRWCPFHIMVPIALVDRKKYTPLGLFSILIDRASLILLVTNLYSGKLDMEKSSWFQTSTALRLFDCTITGKPIFLWWFIGCVVWRVRMVTLFLTTLSGWVSRSSWKKYLARICNNKQYVLQRDSHGCIHSALPFVLCTLM